MIDPLRIVSLLPSATDLVAELGLSEYLVGRTHECDWPPEVESVPIMTRDALDTSTMTAREINQAIGAAKHSGSSIYVLDIDALQEAKPDLILTQELCEVCAVSYSQVANAARLLDVGPKLLSLEPRSISDIFDHLGLVAEFAGVPWRADEATKRLRDRLQKVGEGVRGRSRPTVGSLEWLDPLFYAGHWVPEQITSAGGNEVIGRARQHSSELGLDDLRAADPDVLLLMPCGHSIDRAEEDLKLLQSLPGWGELAAVRSRRVWAVNGPAYFNRPGPRVVRGVEVVAAILHGVGEVEEIDARRLMLDTPHPSRLDSSNPYYEEILDAHRKALAANEDGYIDPASGNWVFTSGFLLRRGSCCESGCRHCPFI